MERIRSRWLVPLILGLLASETMAAGIEWRSFEPKAFAEAKTQGKLVLLSIQAPWGHWDRLMSEITFADPNLISLVNQQFIPIRVDPLLRPDIWARYGMGGWPTTTVLIHTGQPMYIADAARKVIKAGGTYYATEPLHSYLSDLSRYYSANKDAVEKAAEEIAKGVLARKEVGSAPLTPDLLEVTITQMLEAHGAWNPDPSIKSYRIPDPDVAELAFAYWTKKANRDVLDTALHRLTDMARGGIHDQIGGGFHRLSADAAWRVPAFEKLLAVNAEMLQAYTGAYMVTGSSRYREIADDIAEYMLVTLRDPAGWFYAYQSADTRLGEDGDYYTWTLDEVKALLTEEEQLILLPAYDIGVWGELVNSAPRRNVLFLSEGPHLLAERLKRDRAAVTTIFESGRDKLRAARSKRPAPAIGKILVTDAVASAAASLIVSGDLMRRPDLTAAGLKALDFLWDKTHESSLGLMDHAWTPETGRAGLTEFFADQVQTARAMLAAYESTGHRRYLEQAALIAGSADKAFADSLNGGWMDRLYAPEAPGFLSWPTRSLRDNALFTEILLRLRHISGRTEDDVLVRTARKALESWADEFVQYKELSAPFGVAVDRALNPPIELILVGADEALETTVRSLHHPWRVLRRLDGPDGARELKTRQLEAPATGAALFICRKTRCEGPFTKDDKPRAKLDQFLSKPPEKEQP